MSVYLVLKFWSDLKGLKREGKRSETISAPGRPSTSKTDANIKKVSEIFIQNRRLSIWAVAELIKIDKETVQQILHNNFKLKKVCSKMVPRLLTPEQKEIRMNICADILQNIENDSNLLENVITCDESFFFYQYDPESKRQSMRWKSPSSSRQKKAQQSKSKFKAMMVFFSEGLFTWIGCLKVRLLTRSTTRRL